jgi:ornithine cyclodeaminase/alanine dehydrogenase
MRDDARPHWLEGSPVKVAVPALVLRRNEIAALMDRAAYLAAVETGFRCLASGGASIPMPMHIPVEEGGFHVKGARIVLDRAYIAVKVNGNLPDNPRRKGLPTIQGVLLLCDAGDGSVLAVMDSIEITSKRTAAATALAARYLAREDARVIAICGCGEQGRSQLAALVEVVSVKRVFAWDVDLGKARAFASESHEALGVEVKVVKEVRDATTSSDIIVTATSAKSPFLTRECVSAGAFVAAVGADNPDKSELDPGLMTGAKIVVDLLSQCVVMGDLHHAVEAGRVLTADVHAELGDLVVGRKPGRTDPQEITVFDSTGVAIEDAASAAWVYQRAVARNIGTPISFAAM